MKEIKTTPSIIILVIIASIAGLVIQSYANTEDILNVRGSILKTSCNTDINCREYISFNTCENFCVNKDIINREIIFNLDSSCDIISWNPPLELDCRCIDNFCRFK